MSPVVILLVIGVIAAAAAGSAKRRLRTPAPLGAYFPVPGATLSKRRALGYLYQRTATHKHRGIDIPAREGAPVVAPFSGTVVHTNDAWQSGFSGYGKTVVLKVLPPGLREEIYLLFAHLASVGVVEGQHVSAGQTIGTVGRTKYTREHKTALFARSNAHLHFEASENPYPMGAEAPRINPLPVLGLA